MLVRNENGLATLSARILNHTDKVVAISNAYFDDARPEGPQLRVVRTGAVNIAADGKATLGHEAPAAVRIANSPGAGAAVAFTLEFGNDAGDWYSIPLTVPVVARTATYNDVTDSKIITSIKVENARITVVPGQRKAYVDGTVVGTIDDSAWDLPTAVDADGDPVAYRHQTATGGPYGMAARKGKRIEIGSGAPYKDGEGDADYFDAKDVTVGETIMVTIPFQSGDAIVPFKVVAG
ncbi:hypothetical protein [Aeromicrobium sp. 9AM]|uniref:hypothetical protein n=1 Tax=Aeromicrobium sp. 9AM TaxID=2653126 RepID=UPI001359E38A|nr:hypothetical protein [Aeromicrobium sp. 9AM]